MNKSWELYFNKKNMMTKINNIINFCYSRNVPTYPPIKDVLRIFDLVELDEVKVVILGQDPYHNVGQANGIAFSASNTVKTPPSLRNIFAELQNDLGVNHYYNNDLSNWVSQGILLLNSSWTVIHGQPGSDKNVGWKEIVIEIIKDLYKNNNKIIFCLWGNHAMQILKESKVETDCIISSAHPSPFSYQKFKGSKPFSKINELLNKLNLNEIDWSL